MIFIKILCILIASVLIGGVIFSITFSFKDLVIDIKEKDFQGISIFFFIGLVIIIILSNIFNI